MRAHIALMSLAGALLLMGCATSPRYVAASSGALPTSGSYRLSAGQNIPPELIAMIVDRLAEHGLQQGESPSYLVQAALSQRAIRSGAFVPGESQWLVAPAGRSDKRSVTDFVINVTDMSTGEEVHHVAVQSRHGRPIGLLSAALPTQGAKAANPDGGAPR